MSNAVSKNYSRALFMVTKQKENTKTVLGELETIYKATHNDHQLQNFFDDPMTDSHTKINAFQKAIAQQTLTAEAKEFVNVLIKNKRFSFLGSIISDVHGLMDNEQGVQRGVVKSAQSLDPQIIKNIEAEFEKILKSKVHLEYKQSPETVGGVVAEVAGFTFDDSLENHLNKLSDNLIRH